MTLLAEHVPERYRTPGECEVVELELLHALRNLWIVLAGLADAGEISLYVGCEHRYANATEGFRHYLQGDGLAGAGCACDQAMTVGQCGQEIKRFIALCD